MGGLVRARRDVVHVHVERVLCRRVQRESADAAFLEGLAQRDLLSRRLAGVAVAARLQPAVELAVVQEQDAGAVGRDGDRAAGQVPLGDRAVEGVLVAQDEGEDLLAVARLLLVGRRVAAERLRQGCPGIAVGRGHGSVYRKLRMRTTSRLSLPAETTIRRLSGIQRTAKTSVDVS